jgi:hypothetical protein
MTLCIVQNGMAEAEAALATPGRSQQKQQQTHSSTTTTPCWFLCGRGVVVVMNEAWEI